MVKSALEGAQGAGQPMIGSQQESPASSFLGSQPLGSLSEGRKFGPVGTPVEAGKTDSDGLKGIDSRFSSNIERMMADAPGNITINSGRRDSARQAQLWEQAVRKYGSESAARKWVAPPAGHRLSDGSVAQGSRHEHGLAADIGYANDATKQWVHQNAHRYGLHFPLSNEDWHIEPIGSRG